MEAGLDAGVREVSLVDEVDDSGLDGVGGPQLATRNVCVDVEDY